MFKKRRLLTNYDSDSSSSSDDEVDEHQEDIEILEKDNKVENNVGAVTAGKVNNEVIESATEVQEEEEEVVGEPAPPSGLPWEEIKEIYFTLFKTTNLDPFKPWELQLKVLNGYSDFYICGEEDKRRDLYDEWCREGNSAEIEYTDASSDDDDDDDDDEKYSPTVFHYLAHVVSKSKLEKTTIYQDIRHENKKLFKQLEIDACLTKKQQESFTSRLLYYYKHLSLQERTDIFLSLISNYKLNRSCQVDTEVPSESYKLESLLMQLEQEFLMIHDGNVALQRNVQYYVLGIKDKLSVLHSLLMDQ